MTSKRRWKRSFPLAAAQSAKLQLRRSTVLVRSKLFTREIPEVTLLSSRSGAEAPRACPAMSTTHLLTPHAKIDSPRLLAYPSQTATRLLFRSDSNFVQTIQCAAFRTPSDGHCDSGKWTVAAENPEADQNVANLSGSSWDRIFIQVHKDALRSVHIKQIIGEISCRSCAG